MRIIKYLPIQFNPLLSDCRTIAIGTTTQYRKTEATLGTNDSMDGTLYVCMKDVQMGNVHYKNSRFEFNDLPVVNIFCGSHTPCNPKTLDTSYNSSYWINDTTEFMRLIQIFLINEYPHDKVSAINTWENEVQYVDNGYLEGKKTYIELIHHGIFTKGTKFQPNNEYRMAFLPLIDSLENIYNAKSIILNIEPFWPSFKKLISLE